MRNRVVLLICSTLLFSACAASPLVYEFPSVSAAPAVSSPVPLAAMVGPVIDKRFDRSDDHAIKGNLMGQIQGALIAELRSTGLFAAVEALPGATPDTGPSGDRVPLAINGTMQKLVWTSPENAERARTAQIVGVAAGALGLLVYSSIPTDVFGDAAIAVQIRHVPTGRLLLDQTYTGHAVERIAWLNSDKPTTKATMMGKALQTALALFKADLVRLVPTLDPSVLAQE